MRNKFIWDNLEMSSPPYFLSEGVMSNPSSKSKKSYINIIIIIFLELHVLTLMYQLEDFEWEC